jgi:ribosomal protein L19
VPGYEQPKINSALKLAERQHKGKGAFLGEPARTTQTGRRSGEQIRRLSSEQEVESVLKSQNPAIESGSIQESTPE